MPEGARPTPDPACARTVHPARGRLPKKSYAASRSSSHAEALSVTVLIDETRFPVSAPVSPGTYVTVHTAGTTEVTITSGDGSFDVVVPGRALMTFPAPAAPGSCSFYSRNSPSFTGDLIAR